MSTDKLPNLTYLTLGLAYYSVCFQLGYFSRVGIEFISTVGSSDIVTSIALLSPILIAIASFYTLIESVVFSSKIHPFWKLAYLWGGACLLIVTVIMLAELITGSDRNFINVFNDIAILSAFLLITLGAASDLFEIRHEGGYVSLDRILFIVVMTGLLTYHGGRIYSTYAGARCKLILTENTVIEGRFLRSVQQGHLIKIGDRTVFINADRVVQINCRRKSASPAASNGASASGVLGDWPLV